MVGQSTRRQGKYLVRQMFAHPKMDAEFHYSTCLLLLDAKLQLSATVQVASLASQNEPIPQSGLFVVAGWGVTKYPLSESAWPKDLQQGITKYLNNERCADFYPGLMLDQFCFGYDNVEDKTTVGDEGGPFFDSRNGKVYGVISNYKDQDSNTNQGRAPKLGNLVSFSREWIDNVKSNYLDD